MNDLGPWCSVDGRLWPTSEATIAAWDPGALTALGLFETMLVPGPPAWGSDPASAVVALDAHLDRLAASWVALRLPGPAPVAGSDARARLVDTIGTFVVASTDWLVAPRALRLTVTPNVTTLILRAVRLERRAGLHLHRLEGARLLPRHKTLAWFPVERLHPAGHDPAFEGVWLDAERVLEGNTSSLFAVRGGRVLTAPLTAPILPGVTRARALVALGALGIDHEERAPTWDELVSSDEAFATNATLPVAPILATEGRPKDEGPVTRALRMQIARLSLRVATRSAS